MMNKRTLNLIKGGMDVADVTYNSANIVHLELSFSYLYTYQYCFCFFEKYTNHNLNDLFKT